MFRAIAYIFGGHLVGGQRASVSRLSGAGPTSSLEGRRNPSDISSAVDANKGGIIHPQVVLEPSSRYIPESDHSDGLPRDDEAEEKNSSSRYRSSRMNEDTVGHSTEGPDTSSQMENKDLHVGKKNLHRRAASAGVMPTVGQEQIFCRLSVKGEAEYKESQLENKDRSDHREEEPAKQLLDGGGSPWVKCETPPPEGLEGQLNMMEIYKMMKKQSVMHSQNEESKIGEACRQNREDLSENEKDLVESASRDLVFVVQIPKGYDGSNCPMNEVNEGVIAARSSDDQNSKNGGLYFEPMGIFGIKEEELFDGPIEEATDDLTTKKNEESLVEDTMFSMKNYEDFNDPMNENEVFCDTMQIINFCSAVRGRHRGQHLRRVEALEEAARLYASKVMKDLQEGAYMEIIFEDKFCQPPSDETYHEALWRGELFEAFKDKDDIMFMDGNNEVLMNENKDRQSGVEDLIDMHACKIASGMEERKF